MSVNTTNTTELSAEQVQRILVQPLEASAVFLAAGPRVFDTNGSPDHAANSARKQTIGPTL